MVTQAQPASVRDAPAELNVALSKLAAAEAAMQRREYLEARRLAEQAEVDARYAAVVAENVRTQRAAAEVEQGVQALQREIERRPR